MPKKNDLKPMPKQVTAKAEVVMKKVGDEPYIANLWTVDIQGPGLQWASEAEAIRRTLGGEPEWVHLGGKIHVCVSRRLRGLPENSCGFFGTFFIACVLASGKIGVISESDKRRIFKWYEQNKDRQPLPMNPSGHGWSVDEFQQHSEASLKEQERRNKEWKKL